jgi:ferredoxin
MKVNVERDLCIGYGECVRLAPAAFALDAEQLAVVTDPGAADEAALLDAERSCPAGAISIENEPPA